MSEYPHRGVVNRDCRVFETENLFVAGSSVFPTGGHAAPTLMLLALVVRLADHLKREFQL
jgi:choline dehydrogenase-like flavoprotein